MIGIYNVVIRCGRCHNVEFILTHTESYRTLHKVHVGVMKTYTYIIITEERVKINIITSHEGLRYNHMCNLPSHSLHVLEMQPRAELPSL